MIKLSKSFIFELPSDFNSIELQERIRKGAFIELTRYKDEKHFEFLFVGDNLTAEKLRERFKIPAEIKIIESQ